MRIFNDEPRFYDDEISIDIYDPNDGTVIVANLKTGGHWAPAEVYRLPEGRSVVVRVRYQGAAETDLHLVDKVADHAIDMNQDYDVFISWRPMLERPSETQVDNPDFDLGPHWARNPVFRTQAGHLPLF